MIVTIEKRVLALVEVSLKCSEILFSPKRFSQHRIGTMWTARPTYACKGTVPGTNVHDGGSHSFLMTLII